MTTTEKDQEMCIWLLGGIALSATQILVKTICRSTEQLHLVFLRQKSLEKCPRRAAWCGCTMTIRSMTFVSILLFDYANILFVTTTNEKDLGNAMLVEFDWNTRVLCPQLRILVKTICPSAEQLQLVFLRQSFEKCPRRAASWENAPRQFG